MLRSTCNRLEQKPKALMALKRREGSSTMSRKTKLTILVILLALPVTYFLFLRPAQPAVPLPPATIDAKATAASVNAFAFDLFAKLRTAPGNRCFSPYSIHAALSMTHAGAGGQTADQLATALHLTPEARAGQLDLHARLQAPGYHGFELSIANRLWLDPSATILPTFTTTLSNAFLADAQSVDFHTPAALTAINDWTSQRTHGRIPAAITPSELSPATTVVLTNALYFRGNWDIPFQKSATTEGDFFTAPGHAARTMLMSQANKKHQYAQFEADGAIPAFRALSLDYTGGDLAMLFLLPDLGQLDALETALNNQLLTDITRHLRETHLPVILPRLTITDSYSLQKPLQELGITDAFLPNVANFSAMTPKAVYLAAAIHKTFLEINEQGTEAAAVTSGAMAATAAPDPAPAEFIANHPFLFLLRDRATGTLLFLGRFATP